MAAPARKSSSIITYRAKDTIALPPMTLGYSNLIDPETFDPEKPKLTMNGHLTPGAIEALKEDIAAEVYTKAALEALYKDCEENNVKLPRRDPKDEHSPFAGPKDPEAVLEAWLKEPKPGFPIQLPYIKLGNNLNYFQWKDGVKTLKTRSIVAWDGHNKKLNLKKLMLGRGSVVEPIVYGNLFFSKVIGVIQPSLKLVGIRVIELVQFQRGGNNAPTETSADDIAAVMGRDIEAADLSAFMGDDEPEDVETEEQGAPKTPAERAKGMF